MAVYCRYSLLLQVLEPETSEATSKRIYAARPSRIESPHLASPSLDPLSLESLFPSLSLLLELWLSELTSWLLPPSELLSTSEELLPVEELACSLPSLTTGPLDPLSAFFELDLGVPAEDYRVALYRNGASEVARFFNHAHPQR